MKSASKPANEKARLEALAEYYILDTRAEAAFDEITELAADICKTPIATITLIDEDREWYKSRVGIEDEQASRDISFCAHTILQEELLLVPDTFRDERFRDNPFVLEDPPLRFYAGAPLITPEGYAVGTLCVIDHVPRKLGKHQKKALTTLAHNIVTLLEMRKMTAEALEKKEVLARSHEGLEQKVHEHTTENIKINRELQVEIARRKKTEETLRLESEMLSNMSEGVILTNASDGTIIHANPQLEKMFGYDEGELAGKHVSILNAPTDREPDETARKIISVLHESGNWSGEIRNIRKDGTAFWCHASVCIFEHPGYGPVWLGIHRDITDRKVAFQLLADSEEKFHKAFDSSPNIMVINRLEDGCLIEVNSTFEKILGYSRDEAIGKTPVELGIWVDPARRDLYTQLLRKNNNVRDFETEIKTRDGVIRIHKLSAEIFNYHGEPCIVSIGEDITEQKETESTLNIYAQIVKSANSFLSYVDRDYTYRAVNDIYLKAFDRQRGEIVGKTMAELFGRDYFNNIQKPRFDECLTGKTVNYESNVNFAGLGRRSYNVQYSPSYDTVGNIIGVVVDGHDITDLKQAEKELFDSKLRYQTIIDTTADWIWEIDISGRLTFTNLSVEMILGYSPEEISNVDIFDLIHKDERKYNKTSFKKCVEQKCGWHGEVTRWKHKDGSYRYLESHASPILSNTGELVGFRGSDRDVTERVQSEEKLRILYRALESATNPIIIADADQKDFPIIYCNPAFERVTGYKKEEVLGKNPRFLQGDEREQPQLKGIRMALEIGREIRVLLRNYRKDGGLYWNELHLAPVRNTDGDITHWVGVHNDLTELKNIENDLRLKTAAFELASDGLVLTDALQEDNPIIYVNRGFLDLTGYSKTEVLGKNCRFLQGPDSDPETIKNIHNAVKKGKSCRGEIINYRKNGDPFWNLLRIEPYYNYEGKLTHFVGSQTDITKRKMTEKALAASEDKFSKAFRSLPDPLTISSIEDGVIVDVNDSCLEKSGYTREEIIGKSVLELGIWRNLENREEIIQHLLAFGNLVNQEADFVKKNGEIVHCLLSAEIININDKPHILLLTKDITEQKKAETALQNSEMLLRFLYEENLSMYFILTPDFIVQSVNQFGAKSLGYTIEELKGNPVLNVFPVECKQHIISNMERCVENPGAVYEWETRKICKDGSEIWVKESGMFTRSPDGQDVILINCQDITASKKAEETLRHNEAMLSEAQQVAQLGSWELDLTSNNLTWSDQVYEIFGINKEEFGASYEAFLDAVHPDDRQIIDQAYTDSLENKTPYDIEHRLLMKDGTVKFVREKCVTHFRTDGTPLRSLGTVMDITDIKSTQKELEERAKQQNFIAELGQLAISETDISLVFEKAVHGIAQVLDVDYTAIHELLADDNLLILRYGYGWKNGIINNTFIDTGTKDLGGYALQQERPVTVEYLHKECRFKAPELLIDHQVVSIISVVIGGNDGPYGILSIHSTKHRKFTSYDIDFVQSIANVIANIINNKQSADIIFKSRERLRKLAARLQNVREEERKYIAQEIHDELGQRMTFIKMELSWLHKHLPHCTSEISRCLDNVVRITEETIDLTRQIALDLRPSILEDLGLQAAIEYEVIKFSKHHDFIYDIHLDSEIKTDIKRDIVIYRILQEALTNIVRHARASRINVDLAVRNGKLYLTIIDNGKGIDKNRIDGKSLGIIGMHERAASIDGVLEIDRIDTGSQVKLVVPYGK